MTHIPPPRPEIRQEPYSIPENDPLTSIQPDVSSSTNSKSTTDSSSMKIKKRKVQDGKTKIRKTEQSFDDLLNSIFQSDDYFSTSKEIQNYNDSSISIWFTLSDPDKPPCLSNAVLVTLEDNIRKFSSSKFFKTYDVEYLVRLISILERSILNGQNNILSPDDLLSSKSDDIAKSNTIILDNTLKAIKLLFRICLSGRKDNELFSEDLLNLTISVVAEILEKEILPLYEMELGNHPLMKSKTLFGGVCQDLTRVIDLISGFLERELPLGEPSIIKLEFLTIKIIFSTTTAKLKDQLITPAIMESFKVSTMMLISTLFGQFPDQRSFLLDEILNNFTNLTGGKSSRVFRTSNGISIQLVTALIIRLIQTTGSTNDSLFCMTDLDELDEETKNEKRKSLLELCTKRYSSAASNAKEILSYLITRAMKTTKSGNLPFRSLIETFTEDFGKLLKSPEWPAAELFLTTLSMALITILEGDKDGVTASTMALELLGNIQLILRPFKENEKQPHIELALNMDLSDFEKFSTICSGILYYLQSLINKDPTLTTSYQYFISVFGSILSSLWNGTKNEEEHQLHESVSKCIDHILTNGKEGTWIDYSPVIDATCDSSTLVEQSYEQFLHSRNLVSIYDRILNSILKSLDHPKINIRTKSLRVVASLLDHAPDIFSMPQVQKSLSDRIVDVSAQVRDASVDIVGKFIVMKPQYARNFYLILCDRSSDTGLAVRKRVIKLLRDLYDLVDEEMRVNIIDRIMRRVDDEEKVISDMALSFLTECLFPPLKPSQSDNKKENSNNTIVNQYERQKVTSSVTAILEALSSRGDKQVRFLREFFLKVLHPVKGSANSQVIETAKGLVEDLVEQASQAQNIKVSERLLGILSDIVNANGSFMTQDPLSLLSGFFVDESAEAQVACFHALSIYHKTLLKVGKLRDKFLEQIKGILLKRLNKFNLQELSEAVPCLWIACQMSNDTKKLAIVAVSCFRAIKPYYEKAVAKKEVPNDPKLTKLLYLLSCIGRYCVLEDHIAKFDSYQPKQKLKTVVDLILQYLLMFCGPSQSVHTRKIVLKNICAVCIGHPTKFMIKAVIKLLDQVFAGTEEELQETLMRSFLELLYHEEDTANAIAAMKNTKKTDDIDLGIFYGVTDKLRNEGVSSSIMQRYQDKIMEFAMRGESDFSLTASLLLEKITRQGLANIRLSVPAIVSLEMSRRKDISLVARNMHIKLFEKYESLIEGCYVQGVRRAAEYRIQNSKDLLEEFDNFQILYPFMKNNRATKRKFLVGVTNSLEFNPENRDFKYLKSHLLYTIFISNALSTVNFYTIEEVLTVIYGLNRLVLSIGVGINDEAESFIESLQKKVSQEPASQDNDTQMSSQVNNHDESTIIDDEMALLESQTNAAVTMSLSSQFSPTEVNMAEKVEDTDKLKSLAIICIIIRIILSLKGFLAKCYHIKDHTSQNFNPDKPGKDPKPATRRTNASCVKLDIKSALSDKLNDDFEIPVSNVHRVIKFVEYSSVAINEEDNSSDGEGATNDNDGSMAQTDFDSTLIGSSNATAKKSNSMTTSKKRAANSVTSSDATTNNKPKRAKHEPDYRDDDVVLL